MAQQRLFNGGYSFIVIAVAIIIIYFLQVSIPGFTQTFVLNSSAYEGEFWRFVSAIFLHGSMSHLLSNLFALMLFGIILEQVAGTRNFLIVYFGSGILANLISVFFYPSSLGASGAIYGVMGAVTILRPNMMIWAFGLVVPMFVAAIGWVIIDFLGIFVPDGVGNIAHLSGIFVGFLMGLILIRRKAFGGRRRSRQQVMLHEPSMRRWEDQFMR